MNWLCLDRYLFLSCVLRSHWCWRGWGHWHKHLIHRKLLGSYSCGCHHQIHNEHSKGRNHIANEVLLSGNENLVLKISAVSLGWSWPRITRESWNKSGLESWRQKNSHIFYGHHLPLSFVNSSAVPISCAMFLQCPPMVLPSALIAVVLYHPNAVTL